MTAFPPDHSRGQKILEALARRDNAALLALMDDDGIDGRWADDRGQTLLHFAALRGDKELCDALIERKKANVLAMTDNGERPSRMAAVYGHAALARHLEDIEVLAQAAAGLPVVESLAALRKQPGGAGPALYKLACAGHFAAVVQAALRNDERFTREELLYEGQRGESVLLRLCQTGQLSPVQAPEILSAALWRDCDDLFFALRDSLPRLYRGRFNSAHAKWAGQGGAGAETPATGAPARNRSFRLPPKP